ncbi:hypothetical protein [Pelolinea submarina]|uniref:Uncharacterized protein n=1 Tax=Pelolinea submarina TaxID=913107 RepID=A0A347ZRV3_9CHLR|nr:hypothetical protein [Pelolinea submarina]REG11412.1 hypothetical protein DFR64_1293 [Pelolinea submarina]BBB48034.1 hypothetical protein Pelsub_P1262 [Pelolinea submarina]
MSNENEEIKILLMGPSGSGKTWYLNSFARAIECCDEQDEDFEYQLREFSGDAQSQPLFISKPSEKYNSVDGPNDYYWEFERKPKNNISRAKINCSRYLLYFFDYTGNSAMQLSEEISAIVQAAHLVLFFIDPTSLVNNQTKNEEKNQDEWDFDFSDSIDEKWKSHKPCDSKKQGPLTPKEYTVAIKKLFEFISRRNLENLHIAFIVSKADQWLQNYDKKIADVLLHFLGEDFQALLIAYQKNLKIKIFPNSSVGFTDDGTANFNSESNALLDPNIWNPVHSEDPIFWALEDIERNVLARKNSISGWLFADQLLRDYIPYHRLD